MWLKATENLHWMKYLGNEGAQETSTHCHAISTALPKFEKHNQGQMAY